MLSAGSRRWVFLVGKLWDGLTAPGKIGLLEARMDIPELSMNCFERTFIS
jgi:hypothetical protein